MNNNAAHYMSLIKLTVEHLAGKRSS